MDHRGWTNRAAPAALALLVLSGCGKGDQSAQSGAAPQAASASTPAPDDRDKQAALGGAQFNAPITLSLNVDANDTIPRIQGMNGVDPKNTYGATYETLDFTGCSADPNRPPDLALGGPFGPGVVMAWLNHEHLVAMGTYTINYPNAQSAAYGTSNTFVCPVLIDTIKSYLPDQNADIHHGVTFVLARRVFDHWTFENRYETPVPGKGNVKVFAGTVAYSLQIVPPGVSASGAGSANVKLHLDPDNGQWTIDSMELHDPSLSLQTQ